MFLLCRDRQKRGDLKADQRLLWPVKEAGVKRKVGRERQEADVRISHYFKCSNITEKPIHLYN